MNVNVMMMVKRGIREKEKEAVALDHGCIRAHVQARIYRHTYLSLSVDELH